MGIYDLEETLNLKREIEESLGVIPHLHQLAHKQFEILRKYYTTERLEWFSNNIQLTNHVKFKYMSDFLSEGITYSELVSIMRDKKIEDILK
jgi:hypothetical protein